MTDVVPSDPQGKSRKTNDNSQPKPGYAGNLYGITVLPENVEELRKAIDIQVQHYGAAAKDKLYSQRKKLREPLLDDIIDMAHYVFKGGSDLAVERHEAKDSTANPSIDETLIGFAQLYWSRQEFEKLGDKGAIADLLTEAREAIRQTLLAHSYEYEVTDLERMDYHGKAPLVAVSVDTINKLFQDK